MKWKAPNPPGTGTIEERAPASIRNIASVRLRDCIVLTAEARPAETVDVSIPYTAQRMVTLIIQ